MPPTPDERKYFGQLLRDLRGDRSLAEVSAMLIREHNLDAGTSKLSGWERGDYAPKHRSITEVLDEALGASGGLLAALYGNDQQRADIPPRTRDELLDAVRELTRV